MAGKEICNVYVYCMITDTGERDGITRRPRRAFMDRGANDFYERSFGIPFASCCIA